MTIDFLNELTYKIRGAFFEVYNVLGPGLLESVYEAALMVELQKQGLKAVRQKALDVEYKGVCLETCFFLDILVEDEVIIELKSVEKLLPVHHKQLLSYLRLSGKKVGLLVNFNSSDLKSNIVRIANNL